MQIHGIGTDIVEVSRFKKLSDRFMLRCFTDQERQHLSNCTSIHKQAESTAGYFAAKEAIAKALGTGFKGFWPCDIEIKPNALGKPEAKLHGNAAQIAKNADIKVIEVSISHSKTTAVGFAVAQRSAL